MNASIEQIMRTLKLGGLAREWKNIDYKNPEQYLRELFETELLEREANKATRLMKAAGFPVLKEFSDFEWGSSIAIPSSISREEIENADFVGRKENLLFLGAVGTGKTHLATAVAHRYCEKGKPVRFFTAAGLANILLKRNQKGTISSFMASLKKVGLIVTDEAGFVPLHKEAAELLFQVVSACYEQRSLIITSNLEFSEWNGVFGDNRLTVALVDRLVHHSHILVFSGESYRLKASIKRQKDGEKKVSVK